MDGNTFFPLAFRMKYINRWGLMRNTECENLLEHSAECAMLAHALASIGNSRCGKSLDADKIAVKALYHDICEIYTGDLPTPVKYHSESISESYKAIEKSAGEKLLSRLPEDLTAVYADALDCDSSHEEKIIVKAADKLCALIKCITEIGNGNREFTEAERSTRASIEEMFSVCPELEIFTREFLPEFEKSLDEL